MTAPAIRAVVVDDQPLARERLVGLLALESDIDLAGVCATGRDGVAVIREVRPDLVFLDMQMPELDGLGVVEAVGIDRMPLTIFVTAFDEYAVRAFEAQAIDYLLKPFARPRFQQALDRARRHLERHRRAELSGQLLSVVATLRARAEPGPRLMVKSGGRVVFVDVDSIDWAEAEGNYARLHAGTETYLLRQTMVDLLARLGPERFARIHRSRLVNVARVAELRVAGGGDYDVVLHSGLRLGLSRSFRDDLQHRLAAGPLPRS
jgi:two-component system, LytTR family, response regulator